MKFQSILACLALSSIGIPLASAQEREAAPAVVNPPLVSPLRQTIRLDGTWDFATDPKGVGDQEKWFQPGTPLPEKTAIQVPGCWEAQGIGGPGSSRAFTPEADSLPLSGSYMGAAWYRRAVAIPADWTGKQVWLKIGGVHAQGWFWVNGAYLNHNDCYCGTYKYNITDLIQPGHDAMIAVKVRNDVPSGKGCIGWLQRFGGIYRSVEIEATPDLSIDYAYVDGQLDSKKAVVHVKLRSVSQSPRACTVEVTTATLDGHDAGRGSTTVTLSGRQTEDAVLDVPLDPLNPWSPEHPNLYRAEIVLKAEGKAIDGWIERFGVRKWEVRGNDFYLNNHKYFVRGFGDDYIYPLTLCSPASRDEHRKHLKQAKDYGFTYVRHHTHCEVPEYYDVCDELGIMVQPELPYYGTRLSAGPEGAFRPKDDLRELITHYRRHVSLATYCTGNEGWMGSPLDVELYQLAKQLDPTRLVLHQDGGKNTVENSDFGTGRMAPEGPRSRPGSRPPPWVCHEYLNLATDFDPRLAPQYTGAQRPPVTPEVYQEILESLGLAPAWASACVDAGHQLQRIYQQRGLEHARRDAGCGGYIYWTIVDVTTFSDQGLFNPFWKPKASTAEFFRQFNGPTALLAEMSPGEQILTAGQSLKVQWLISHFSDELLKERTLRWKLVAGDRVLQAGEVSGVSAAVGDVKSIGQSVCRIPAIDKPVKARLMVELAGLDVHNSWDLWLFPALEPRPAGGAGLCATPAVHQLLAKRYPALTLLGTPGSERTGTVLTTELDAEAGDALRQGKNVVLLKLPGPRPGAALGWWWQGPQTGTAIAPHPAFGDFPHEDYLNEVMFRIVGTTIQAGSPGFKSVEPLMVGNGLFGYLMHVFQAKAGKGKLLASGLDLLGDKPEAAYLLDQLLNYVHSNQFTPTGTIDLDEIRADQEMSATLAKTCNGWSQTVKTIKRIRYPSFVGELPMCVARQSSNEKLVAWKTQPVPADVDPAKPYTFRWLGALGWFTAPPGKFTLWLGDRPLVDFDVVRETTTWTSADGAVSLSYTVRGPAGLGSTGMMELTLPASLLVPGEAAELRVVPAQTGSNRWFGLFEYSP